MSIHPNGSTPESLNLLSRRHRQPCCCAHVLQEVEEFWGHLFNEAMELLPTAHAQADLLAFAGNIRGRKGTAISELSSTITAGCFHKRGSFWVDLGQTFHAQIHRRRWLRRACPSEVVGSMDCSVSLVA